MSTGLKREIKNAACWPAIYDAKREITHAKSGVIYKMGKLPFDTISIIL